MINRDGTDSNGYFGSSDHVEDVFLDRKDFHIGQLGWDLMKTRYAPWVVYHTIYIFFWRKCLRIRRWYRIRNVE